MDEAYEKFKGIISKDELEKLIKNKIESVGGLLTREGAIAIIAAEYGIDLGIEEKKERIKIKDLQEGMNNVSVIGRVKRIYPMREFENGKVGNIVIEDDTGEIRVALWNDRTKILEKLKKGAIIEIKHGYVKKGFRDTLDLNVGTRGTVELSNVSLDLPEIEEKTMKIGEINEDLRDITVTGRVKSIFDIREFERIDGGTGKVGSIILKDDTGEIRVVLWNEKADIVENISEETDISIENARVKEGMDGLEVHVNRSTGLSVEIPCERKIKNLKRGKVEITGRVSEVDENGFFLMDESGEIFVETEEKYKTGDLIRVSGEFNENILPERIEKIEMPFPTLEELKNPKRGKIGDQGMVILRGVVKSRIDGEECCEVLIDDGMEEMRGIVYGYPEPGEEYLFKCMVNNNKFICYEFQKIDILREAKIILNRVGGNG